MTESRETQRERQDEAATADREPEVRPEVIQDLDVPGGDADVMGGGLRSIPPCCGPQSYNTN